jgi:nucleotide-binding universal stress UspA family protein
MKHILLAIDHSGASWEATRQVMHMAPRLTASVTVLSVVPSETRRREAQGWRWREYEVARELVDDVAKDLVRVGVRAKGEVRSCRPKVVARELLSSAARLEADLIVMGSRARGEVSGVLFGSVSHEVAMQAGCPVVIVPAGAATKLTTRLIVLVIDGEGDPKQPVNATAELAHALGAAVEVVCVGRTLGDDVEPGQSPSPPNPDEEAVAAVAATLKKGGLEVRSRVIDNRSGLAPEIAREVMATGADMVVIGVRAIGWVGGDVGAGAAEAVLHRTQRPVVVAPSRRRS